MAITLNEPQAALIRKMVDAPRASKITPNHVLVTMITDEPRPMNRPFLTENTYAFAVNLRALVRGNFLTIGKSDKTTLVVRVTAAGFAYVDKRQRAP